MRRQWGLSGGYFMEVADRPDSFVVDAGRTPATSAEEPLSGLSRLFAFAVVFLAGWYLCLPETEVAVPWWAVKHKVGGVLLHEAVFALYLGLGGARIIWRRALPAHYVTRSVAMCLVLLAIWCAVASMLGPLPLHDWGRSARLVMMAVLLLGVTHWSASDPLFVLRTFLFGLVAASAVNLTLSFMNPVILAAGALPRLMGQNSPGPPMGIAVCLAAWLILLSRRRNDAVFAVSITAVCGAGAMISYSKTGMLAALLGFLSVALVAGRVASSRRGHVLVLALIAVIVGGSVYLRGEAGRRMLAGLTIMIREKIESAQVDQSVSMQERLSYYRGVTEIVTRYPVGVGYSGFRDAMMRTAAYQTGLAADESAIPQADSNPHGFFLYYAAAGGIVGGALAATAFLLLCAAVLRALLPYGVSGVLLAASCVVAYMVLASSVAYLLNSPVMLLPSGIAAGLYAHQSLPGRSPGPRVRGSSGLA